MFSTSRLAASFLLALMLSGCDESRLVSQGAVVTVTPQAVDFGEVPGGDSASAWVEIRNDGSAPLNLSALTLSGDAREAFWVLPLAALQLAPGAVERLEVRYFAPRTAGADGASLWIVSDARNAQEVLVSLGGRSTACLPRTCAMLDKQCGAWPDGCGGVLSCGGCGDGSCQPEGTCAAAGCAAKTCTQLGFSCGTVSDGCGKTVECGSCTGGSCVEGSCQPAACQAQDCTALGAQCGLQLDGCGGTLDCGSCASGSCQAGQCTAVPSGTDLPVPPLGGPLASVCALQFPPTRTLPCAVSTQGTLYYVRPLGDDAHDGSSPATAWRTLGQAAVAAPAGSSILVAQGIYTTAELRILKDVTFKGGYDDTFADWDPDAHLTYFVGRLVMQSEGAVMGGFRMVARPTAGYPGIDASSGSWHQITAGSLVRNYIEVSFEVTTQGFLYGLIAAAAPGKKVGLYCNDVYVNHDYAPAGLSAIELGNIRLHDGLTHLDSNRVCAGSSSWVSNTVSGYGACTLPGPAKVLLTNNILERAGTQAGGCISFYACEADLEVTVTNNTLLCGGDGISGYASSSPPVPVRWRLYNNILAGKGTGSAVNLGSSPAELVEARGNLTFGFSSNGLLPTPLSASNNDLGSALSLTDVFTQSAAGDFSLEASGPGTKTGVNLHNDPDGGFVTRTLLQTPRPATGAWDRGAQ